MSNRARELSTKITEKLRDAVQEAHDELIHLAFLHNPNATESAAMQQADTDIVEMLKFYIEKFGGNGAQS